MLLIISDRVFLLSALKGEKSAIPPSCHTTSVNHKKDTKTQHTPHNEVTKLWEDCFCAVASKPRFHIRLSAGDSGDKLPGIII